MSNNKAVKLIEQVLNEGRFKDTYIDLTSVKNAELDAAIAKNDIYRVTELLKVYKKAKKFLEEAKRKEKTQDRSHYWEIPNWILTLLLPIGGTLINVWSTSKKTKFSDEEISKMEEIFDKCIAKAEAFLAEDFIDDKKTKHEAACILIEALNTLLNE